MIWKCANPDCSSSYVYLEGRLYRFPKQPIKHGRRANTHSVQHFWLCTDCCATNALEYDEGRGVALVRHLDWASAPEPSQFIAQA